MSARTIAGDVRRIRSLMRLGPDIGSCVIRREDYGELLKLFDAIETKAKRMQDALKPVLECGVGYPHCCQAVVGEAQRIMNGGAR